MRELILINEASTKEDLEYVLRHLSHKAGRMTVKAEDYPAVHADIDEVLTALMGMSEVTC